MENIFKTYWSKLSKSLRKEIIIWSIFLPLAIIISSAVVIIAKITNHGVSGVVAFFTGMLAMIITRIIVDKYIEPKMK